MAIGIPGRVHRLGLRRVLLANLVTQVGIVFTGGIVRVTGSGLGCPTWPECAPGSFRPTVDQAEGWHKHVEFGNRLLTYVVALAALAALLAVWHHTRDRRLRLLGAVPFLGVPAQAVVGGISVLTDLNPWVVSLHFLLSGVLIAVSTWLLDAVRRLPASPPLRVELRGLALAVGAVAAVVVVLGTVVTGSGPHSGDAEVSQRFGFDVRTVSWLHADAVWLFVGLVVALMLALRLGDGPPEARHRAAVLLAVTLGQGAIGYAQYVLALPAVLVALHMLGAALLIVAVTAAVRAVLRPTLTVGSTGGADRVPVHPVPAHRAAAD